MTVSAINPTRTLSRMRTKTLSTVQTKLGHLTRAARMSRGEVAIWLLSAGLVAGGVALLRSGAVSTRPVVPSMQVSIWILLVAFAAAERFVVHVHFRRSAHSMSLGEIPLVFGLVFASGHDVILAGAIGRLLVLGVHRRLPPIRLAFNFGQFLLGNCIAVLVFHAVAGSATQIDPTVWAAAALAAVATSIAAVLLISTAVSLSDSRLSISQIADSLRTDLAVAAVNTSIGLCAATIVDNDWRAAILMAVPVVGMYLTFQAYVTERQRHGRLEFLYEAARALSRTPEIGSALEGLLGQALDAFRAEVAEIIFFSPDGNDALRTTVRANGAGSVLEGLEPSIVGELRTLIGGHGPGACATREIADGPLADYLAERQLGRGMFAVLAGERNCMGAVMIGNPSGRVDRFTADDVKLFETLANNTSVALENDRLGHTVWRMKELQRELEHQASHDPLTDLANRLLFAERVSKALERDPERVSVIFIDINDFKTINDTLGHAAGDELLIAISRRLRDCVRPSDTLARLGGDEFAIMLERTASQDEAIQIAERINRRLAERFSIGGQHLTVRASAGIATGAAGAGGPVSTEELIRNADVAMYRAKQASKRGWELFESGMEVPVLKRHGLKQRLREAVREDSFDVHYQPIVELESGQVTACEALVRWLDGPRGCVNPGSFIPVAEEMGVIVPLGRSILERSCREAQRWPAQGGSAPAIHVNLSPVELRDPHFLTGVAGVLERTGLRPDRLVLEITEGVVLRDPEKSIAILHQLRALGVQLALDDFGTGYSSLSHLRSLPIDWVKIGKPFVDAVDEGGLDRPFVRMILELAADLNLGVVAEGIEHTQQLGALRELGCGYGQGFYLGMPGELQAAGPRLNDIADYRRPALVA
ncbi:MAG TPA: EAL domain-containing protein [Solirubrobacteraceae bacterium]|nr:EAL domain-containing protein [Solirubrobacteraceae bacterium]